MQERLVWYFFNQPASNRQKPYNERTLSKIIKLTISVKLIVLLHPLLLEFARYCSATLLHKIRRTHETVVSDEKFLAVWLIRTVSMTILWCGRRKTNPKIWLLFPRLVFICSQFWFSANSKMFCKQFDSSWLVKFVI